MKSENRTVIIIFSLFILFGFSIYFYTKFRYRNLEKNKVFLIGKIVDILNRNNGTVYSVGFSYQNKVYESRFSELATRRKINDLVYVIFQKNRPEINGVMFKHKVPSCYNIKNNPPDGWSEIPKDTCR